MHDCGEPTDNFMNKMDVLVEECSHTANSVTKQNLELVACHTKCVLFFGLKVDEEIAKSSVTFLKIFQEFIKNAVDCMPPEEKKRGAGRATKGGASSLPSGPPAGGMNAFMAEI